ncbi:hypothetical protein [Protaetiibacter intestinalis]|uniref:Uncharacterized protein n=1 Tax=Protaetiibacter intestinalis TaxID=2419774 RepID=A0A387B5H6_9MICO|nr:hypothetical protein [Protaetiibacter intestinalis]AYF98882.1 hypothetical protein D7I47_11870 [Protaetiibacter intestinalis]
MLTTAARALARSWPGLLAWFLAGWTARLLLLRLAGAVGNEWPLLGQLILPLAVIARLASYVAMFLVLRSALPHVPDPESTAAGWRGFLSRWGTAISAAILPFFVIYAAWGMIAEDSRDYASSALDQANYFADQSARALDVTVDAWSLSLLAVAFAARWLLQRFREKLPRWTAVVSAYLEAVWVLVALLIVRELLAGVPNWFATRRMFAPVVDAVVRWRDDTPWFRGLGDAFSWLMTQLGDVVFQPLAWVALAGVVYLGSRTVADRSTAGARTRRARAVAVERWNRLPGWVRTGVTAITGGFQERWLPIAGSVRLIWSAGPLVLAGFLLAYAVVHAAGEWAGMGLFRMLGPNPYAFWAAVDELIDLAIVMIVIPLQLVLVAAAYDTAARGGVAPLSPVAAAEPEAVPNR